jgi:predicted HTH domain antitoxin
MDSKKYDLNNTKKLKSLRLNDSIATLVSKISNDKNISESEYNIRSLIIKDISKYKINKAIEAYKNREINVSKAAEIADLSYREFLDILKEKGVALNMDGFNIDYGIESIEKSLKK